MAFSTEVINDKLNIFTARLVLPGQAYGSNMCLRNETGAPMVEFYDLDHRFTKDTDGTMLGQFISRYYVSTLFEDWNPRRGLNLEGGVAKWSLDSDAVEYSLGFCLENMGLSKSDFAKAIFVCTIFNFPRFGFNWH